MCKSWLGPTLNLAEANRISADVQQDPEITALRSAILLSKQICLFIPPSLLDGLSIFEHFGGKSFQEAVEWNLLIYPLSTGAGVFNKEHHGLFDGSSRVSESCVWLGIRLQSNNAMHEKLRAMVQKSTKSGSKGHTSSVARRVFYRMTTTTQSDTAILP